ncbi:MAG: prepilin-type N-terminal cleavage/methylation domain-containing protein [Planctomycetota bacterium]
MTAANPSRAISRTTFSPRPETQSGVTLVELMVVLLILAALAGAAVLSTEHIVDQTRDDQTRRTLTSIEQAVIGRPGLIDASGQHWIQGFVADMGRLPRAFGDAPVLPEDPRVQLQELWVPPMDPGAAFAIESPPGDLGVQLAAGWRGPYLQLPYGVAELRDAYGNGFVLRRADGMTAENSDPIAEIVALGSDGEAGGVGYATDLAVTLESALVPARYHGDVPVRVSGVPAGEWVILRIYGPVDGSAGTVAQVGPLLETGGIVTALFADVSIGRRVLRAYRVAASTVVAADDPIGGAVAGRVTPLTVVQGGVDEIQLEFD